MNGHLYRHNAVFDFRQNLEDAEVLAIDINSVPGAETHRSFVPFDDLKRLLPEHVLKTLLGYYDIPMNNWKVIQERYLRVFTILFVIDKAKEIERLLHWDRLADERLPFEEHDVTILPGVTSFFQDFYKAQWKFCAYKIRQYSLNDTRLAEEHILPITSRELLNQGANSWTYKVEIHPSYNFLAPKVCVNISLKTECLV